MGTPWGTLLRRWERELMLTHLGFPYGAPTEEDANIHQCLFLSMSEVINDLCQSVLVPKALRIKCILAP